MSPILIHSMIQFGILLGVSLVPVFYLSRARRNLKREVRDEVEQCIAPDRTRLFLATGLAGVAFLVWMILDAEAIQAGDRKSILNASQLLVFHGIWWPFSFVLIRKHERASRSKKGIEPVTPTGSVRTASLTRRSVAKDLPGWSRVLFPLLAVLALSLFIWRMVTVTSETAGNWVLNAFLFEGCGLVTLLISMFWVRREVLAPQALPESGPAGEELAREMERHRLFRVRGVYFLQLLMAIFLLGMAAVQLEVAHGIISPKIMTWVGSFGGAGIGLLGAGFGTLASLRSFRLQSLRARVTTNS